MVKKVLQEMLVATSKLAVMEVLVIGSLRFHRMGISTTVYINGGRTKSLVLFKMVMILVWLQLDLTDQTQITRGQIVLKLSIKSMVRRLPVIFQMKQVAKFV